MSSAWPVPPTSRSARQGPPDSHRLGINGVGLDQVGIEAFGGLFEGGDVSAQANAMRKDLHSVTADCKDALAAA